jgi:hypothetical protein
MVAPFPIWYTFPPLNKAPMMTRALAAGGADRLRSMAGIVRLGAREAKQMVD